MTDLLVRLFVKDSQNINASDVRRRYGTLSSITGIVCNIFLFVLKYIMGTVSGSVSIVSDAFNNLSDSASCIVTLLGYKMASKPADKDHPFGHGRMEYLTALFIAVLILVVAFELLKDSVDKVIHPEKITFSIIVLASLILSILIKLWMSFFNAKLGKRINSMVMLATSKDSRTDVIATSATCISVISALFTDLPVDGIMGIVVSFFIFKSGIDIVRDTVDKLLGGPADPEIVGLIKEIVLKYDKIIGIHDLVIHNYGPGNMIGSFHAEVKSTEDILEVHDMIDCLEREIHKSLKIMMTVHMDPVETDNERVNALRKTVSEIICGIDGELGMHDFRTVIGDTHTNLIFDVVVPYGCRYGESEIKKIIDEKLAGSEEKYYSVINFDYE
ncbi:MAG: cation diffusion facilitator family transporter [Clostridium sp.]|nr:cation diffusion facilitator family transporter [Clostridium sp.]MCM1547251.1 cation diffusion facilitator family transporter [Ruminococcus sp.]